MEQRHQLAVSQFSRSLRARYEQQVPFSSVGSISSASTSSLQKSYSKDSELPSSTSNRPPALCNIIRIDPNRATAVVEPNVPFGELINACLKFQLLPHFVSRFPYTTVGTAFTITSVESCSFKTGLFHHNILSIEVVLQNGDVKRASSRENPELFNGFINTRSTLGTLTLLELRLIPTAPFVELSYLPVSSAQEATTLLSSVVHEPFDYADALLFSPTRGVVIVGRRTMNRNVYPIRRLLRPSDPLFHKHAENCLSKALKSREGMTELIPLADYLFRFSPSVFWLSQLASESSSATSLLSRAVADPALRHRRAHEIIATGGLAQRIIAQEVSVPLLADNAAMNLLNYIDANLAIYPLYLCPARDDSNAPFHTWQRTNSWPLQTKQMLLGVSIFGLPGPKTRLGIINNNSGSEYSEAFVEANRALERVVRELGGQKWLNGTVFSSEEDFWAGLEGRENGGREGYAGLRARCGAEGLEGLWEVVKMKEGVRVVGPRDSGGMSGRVSLMSGRMSSMSGRPSVSSDTMLPARMSSPLGPPSSPGSGKSIGLPTGKTSRSASIRNAFKRTTV